MEEIAEVLKVSVVTVMRDWSTARAWLYRKNKWWVSQWILNDGNRSMICCNLRCA